MGVYRRIATRVKDCLGPKGDNFSGVEGSICISGARVVDLVGRAVGAPQGLAYVDEPQHFKGSFTTGVLYTCCSGAYSSGRLFSSLGVTGSSRCLGCLGRCSIVCLSVTDILNIASPRSTISCIGQGVVRRILSVCPRIGRTRTLFSALTGLIACTKGGVVVVVSR